jgi:hypothetical protein
MLSCSRHALYIEHFSAENRGNYRTEICDNWQKEKIRGIYILHYVQRGPQRELKGIDCDL